MIRLPKELDIDRLHAATELILSGKYRYRNQGTTLAYMHLMLGEVLVPTPGRFLYVGETMDEAYDVCDYFGQLASHSVEDWNAIRFHTTRSLSFECGQTFHFTGVDRHMESVLCGSTFDRIFFDVSDATQSCLNQEGKLTSIMQELRIHLNSEHGDLV